MEKIGDFKHLWTVLSSDCCVGVYLLERQVIQGINPLMVKKHLEIILKMI